MIGSGDGASSTCAFHDAVLATGGVPLPVLDEYSEAWIKNGGIGPYPQMEK